MMTTAAPPAGFVRLVVGYDGSPPATRALDAAVRLLQGRAGGIDVVYVAQLSSLAALSPGAIAEIESDFDEIEQELRTAAAGQLRASEVAWEFERRQGIAADQLIGTLRGATPDPIPGEPEDPWPGRILPGARGNGDRRCAAGPAGHTVVRHRCRGRSRRRPPRRLTHGDYERRCARAPMPMTRQAIGEASPPLRVGTA
jgi:hypothetical protein